MKKLAILCLLLCSAKNIYAQQGLPFYNHYLVGDKMLINPSYAGQNPDVISINGTYRNQWDDLPESPNTQTLSVHGNVVDRLAVGAYFFNDRNGATKLTGFNLTAAYHIPLDDYSYSDSAEPSVFSFGVGASNVSQRFDFSRVVAENLNDAALQNDSYNSFFLNLGISAKYMNFTAGVSVLDIAIGENLYFLNNIEPLPTWYYFNLGYNWYVTEGIRLEPSLVYNLNSNSDRHLDLNLLGHFGFGENEQGVAVGVSYKQGLDSKTNQALFVSPVVKAKIGSVKAGVSYDIGLSDFQTDGRKQGLLFSLGFDLENPFGNRYN
jgi:type IX secretion system PorP/SprF family membrane protein